MKKKLPLLAIASFLLAGCAATDSYFSMVNNVYGSLFFSSKNMPLFLAYDSEDVIRDQSEVATITSVYEMEIDDVKVNSANMRSANAGASTGTAVDVLPGTYTVKIFQTSGENSNPDPVKVSRRASVSVGISNARIRMGSTTQHFEAGQIYSVDSMMMSAVVSKNTSEEMAKKIAETRKNAAFNQGSAVRTSIPVEGPTENSVEKTEPEKP
jgi:hypothetical protein